MSWFGPVVCAKEVNLSHAVFEAPVTLEIAAREVSCYRTRWEATAAVRLRYAATDLHDAVLTSPVAVTSHPAPFKIRRGVEVDEDLLADGKWRTLKRFERALNVTVNSVVFRSSGQDLTTAGTYIEMASRVTEPILLGLAVLAVRGRVKR